MNVLLTGATGFVAHHLAAALLRAGRQVHLVVRPTSNRERLHDLPGRPIVHEHDGTTQGMLLIVEQARPEVVFHLASLFLPQHTAEDVAPLIQSNLLFGAQLLDAMVAHGVTYLINAGTFAQHYEGKDYSPVNLYAATKQAFEAIVQYYVEAHGMRAVTLKLFDNYGPNDPRKKIFTLFRQASESGTPLGMSPGEQKLALVYIDDVVRALLHAEQWLVGGRIDAASSYAVNPDRLYTLQQVAAIYGRVTGQMPLIEWGGRPYRQREVMEPWLGTRLPGWEPWVDLEEGIRRMEGLA